MYNMKLAGAVAFSNYKNSIENAKFMQLALEYANGIDTTVIAFAQDEKISGSAQVNEGENSTRLGLKGIPHLAEEITVARDLQILEYAGGRLHFSDISSAESAKLIGASKKSRLNATASVAWYHLIFNDMVLEGFDSNYKVLPPLRTESDRKGLIKALKEGKIDAITSNHQPQNIERKEREFEYAGYGINGLQVVFAALNTFAKELDLDTLIESLGIRPYQVLNKETPTLEEGSNANFTLFDPFTKWTFDKTNNQSLAENNPLLGTEFTGKVVGTLNGKVSITF
jgi:dihydroorotase